ncbi:ATP-binding protein [Microbacterium yannicii]|uniref:histidine kinase n=1 Tax=Microbacterium yannicii TaxID=671622 RepID=A0ABP9MGI2_9MICO|nr:HAMP domain-containing sensor histidine kinase [Microbacterium yannicii]MCO5953257.1 HAMP domain-containing histidine kinase [Microbacterium yannicii]
MNFSRLGIRARITGGSLMIAILISIAAGVLIYNQVQRIVNEGQVRVLEGIEGQYVTAINDGDTEEPDLPGPGQFVALVDPSGAVMLDTLPDGLTDQVPELAAQPDGVRDVETNSSEFLVQSTSVAATDGTWRVITASTSDDEVLNDVAILLIVSIAVINIGFGVASWWIGSAALRPVTRLRRSAEELVSAPSAELLPVGPAQDEIADLATTLNELIGGLRASAERERQIVSDASHEFRTPLAIIQTRLELAQREAGTLDEMKADVTAAQRTLARLSSLATSMLELSRIDAQEEPGRATIAELAAELADAADRGRHRVGGRDIRIEYSDQVDDSGHDVAVSEMDFGRVCDNLVNNALAAIAKSGIIELTLTQEAQQVLLTVRDDGGGMDEAYVPLAFDRFSRQSDARTRGGAGLGLPLVAGIATLSGGSVELDNRPGIGLCVHVTFPFAARSST